MWKYFISLYLPHGKTLANGTIMIIPHENVHLFVTNKCNGFHGLIFVALDPSEVVGLSGIKLEAHYCLFVILCKKLYWAQNNNRQNSSFILQKYFFFPIKNRLYIRTAISFTKLNEKLSISYVKRKLRSFSYICTIQFLWYLIKYKVDKFFIEYYKITCLLSLKILLFSCIGIFLY